MDKIITDHTIASLETHYDNQFLFKTVDYAVMCEATEMPWLQIIPNRSMEDTTYAGQLYAEIYQLAEYLKTKGLGPHFNVAKIGNKLPFYHIHLVFRHKNDPAWPEPIWCGINLPPNPNAKTQWLAQLKDYPTFQQSKSS